MEAELGRRQRHIKDQVELAKSRYYANLAEGVHDIPFNSRLVWEYIILLAKGETAHHNRRTNMEMRNEDGSLAQYDKENMDVMHPHFGRVFNNQKYVKFTVPNLIRQREMMQYLDRDITWAELKQAIANLKTQKAPGLNQVPPEAFKSMDDEILHMCSST